MYSKYSDVYVDSVTLHWTLIMDQKWTGERVFIELECHSTYKIHFCTSQLSSQLNSLRLHQQSIKRYWTRVVSMLKLKLLQGKYLRLDYWHDLRWLQQPRCSPRVRRTYFSSAFVKETSAGSRCSSIRNSCCWISLSWCTKTPIWADQTGLSSSLLSVSEPDWRLLENLLTEFVWHSVLWLINNRYIYRCIMLIATPMQPLLQF